MDFFPEFGINRRKFVDTGPATSGEHKGKLHHSGLGRPHNSCR